MPCCLFHSFIVSGILLMFSSPFLSVSAAEVFSSDKVRHKTAMTGGVMCGIRNACRILYILVHLYLLSQSFDHRQHNCGLRPAKLREAELNCSLQVYEARLHTS